jgi:hypothetical protein
MIAGRVLYRARQFWNALHARPEVENLAEIRRTLNTAQWILFSKMQPGEQAHSIQVYQILTRLGETCPDLLAAALLHDAGKVCVSLHAWERAFIVVVRALFPGRATAWGAMTDADSLRTWKRPFIVAEHHPAWGAEMAQQAGSSPLTVALIRRHQEKGRGQGRKGAGEKREEGEEDLLLSVLQAVDDES